MAAVSCVGQRRQVLSIPPEPALEPVAERSPIAAPESGEYEDVTQPLADGETEAELAPPPIPPQQAAVLAPHPLEGLGDSELEARLLNDPTALGPASLGRPGSGALFNGKQMPTGTQWKLVSPNQTWGTDETIAALSRCIDRVNQQVPDTPPVHIGDISTRRGGHHAPHTSHQSGRDVDVGYYYYTKKAWYTRATASNLDVLRTWIFIRAVITETDVQAIFMDRAVQKLLRAHAESIGEDATWLDDIFGGPSSRRRPLITHEPGHRTHVHVRFYNPVAQETGRRIYPLLLKHKLISPPTYYVKYKARRGDSLSRIARRYKTTVKALKRANRLRSSRIYRGRTYKIPRRGGVSSTTAPLVIPARRLPPPPAAPGSPPTTPPTVAPDAATNAPTNTENE